MKVTICDVCEEERVVPLELQTEHGQEVQMQTHARYIGPKGVTIDMCWQCFDALREANE